MVVMIEISTGSQAKQSKVVPITRKKSKVSNVKANQGSTSAIYTLVASNKNLSTILSIICEYEYIHLKYVPYYY